MTNTEQRNRFIVQLKIDVEIQEFCNEKLHQALRECLESDLGPLYMPDLIEARINSDNNTRIWQDWFTTPSIKATGTTKQGNNVVIYAHTPNYFSNPDNIENSLSSLVDGAGILQNKEFQRLLDLEDNKRVFVVDYKQLRKTESGAIKLKDALKHPQTIPFLGGEEKTLRYLERFKEVFGNRIDIWYSDDLSEKPLARLLFAGCNYYDSLNGDDSLDCSGRFAGVNFSSDKKGWNNFFARNPEKFYQPLE